MERNDIGIAFEMFLKKTAADIQALSPFSFFWGIFVKTLTYDASSGAVETAGAEGGGALGVSG